jgi:hypothetical protein
VASFLFDFCWFRELSKSFKQVSEKLSSSGVHAGLLRDLRSWPGVFRAQEVQKVMKSSNFFNRRSLYPSAA